MHTSKLTCFSMLELHVYKFVKNTSNITNHLARRKHAGTCLWVRQDFSKCSIPQLQCIILHSSYPQCTFQSLASGLLFLDGLKEGTIISSSLLFWFDLLSHCVLMLVFCHPSHSCRLSLFFPSLLCIYYLVIYFSVLNSSTVLLLVSVQNVKINSSKHTSRSSSSHLLESCISFPCLCCFLCPVSFPCKSNQF